MLCKRKTGLRSSLLSFNPILHKRGVFLPLSGFFGNKFLPKNGVILNQLNSTLNQNSLQITSKLKSC